MQKELSSGVFPCLRAKDFYRTIKNCTVSRGKIDAKVILGLPQQLKIKF